MGFRIKYAAIKGCLILAGISFFAASSFSQSVQFASPVGMHFGLIEFAASHSGTVTLATNGSVTLTATGLSYQGDAVPGQITINGNSGIIELKCESTASLGGGLALQVSDIEARLGSGGAAGSGNPCQGIGGSDPTALVIDLSGTPNARIYFGGVLNIPSNSLNNNSGTYTTNGGGGDPLTLSATVQ